MIPLRKDIAGQHVVRQHRGRRHENLVGHNELLILQGLINLVLIRIAQQRVIAKTKNALIG